MNYHSKAALVGLSAGIAGAWAMDQFTRGWKRFVPDSEHAEDRPPLPYSQQEWDSTSRCARSAARCFLQRTLSQREEQLAAQIVHFVVGGVAAGAYAALLPRTSRRLASGMLFGGMLWLVGEELAMTLLKINNPLRDYSAAMHLNSLGEHIAYGTVTSLTIRALSAII